MNTERRTVIASLPRCRSAWLSVALSVGECTAHHDLLNDFEPQPYPIEYRAALSHNRFEVDCSSRILTRPELIEECDLKVIFIHRDADTCRRSWVRHLGQIVPDADKLWPHVMEWWRRLLNDTPRERVIGEFRYDSLGSAYTIGEISFRVAPGMPFDFNRIKRLQKLNIQEHIKPRNSLQSWVSDLHLVEHSR